MIRIPPPPQPGGDLGYRPLDMLPTGHCELDGQEHLLHHLEWYRPEPRAVKLRCKHGHGCRKGEGTPRVELAEDADGRVHLTEEPPVEFGYHVEITPNGNPVRGAALGPMARMRNEVTRLHLAARGLTGGRP